MKIMPNCKNFLQKFSGFIKDFENAILDLKAPVLGVQRHSNFKELRKPFRVSKPRNSTISLVCMSGNIFHPHHMGIYDSYAWKNDNSC